MPPDIPPAWVGRGHNAPVFVARFAALLAELRELGENGAEEVARATTANARAVLQL